jgi:acyl-coenzyme A thioesterase PaaI-like protein
MPKPSSLPGTAPGGYAEIPPISAFARHLGPLYERTGKDGYTRAFRVAPNHTDGEGVCHAGMLMSFADTTLGHAVTRARGPEWATVRLVTDFIAAAQLGEWVEGLGEVAGINGDLVVVRGRIWCGERTIMIGAGVFKMLKEAA